MVDNQIVRQGESVLAEKKVPRWYESEEPMVAGFPFPQDLWLNHTKRSEFHMNACSALMKLDPKIQQMGATFEHWTSTGCINDWQVGYVQTYDGMRIIDTRLIYQLREAFEINTKGKHYDLVKRDDFHEAVALTDMSLARQFLYVTFAYKRLIENPTHNPKSEVADPSSIESLIDDALEQHRSKDGVRKLIREETKGMLDVWVPDSYDMCTGTSVELHKGFCACVGYLYFDGNPFPQFIYVTIDKEKPEVTYIRTNSFVIHATRPDGTGVTSRPTTTDRRNPRFAETDSKVRPGQIRAQLE